MKLRPAFKEHLHSFRDREFQRIFALLPQRLFDSALEIGAGDGFQTKLLQPYCRSLISSDYDLPITSGDSEPNSNRCQLDAEEIGTVFAEKQFDLIYSSSVLEHLKSPRRFLWQAHNALKDDGIMIHVLPNVTWKLCHMLGHHAHVLLKVTENPRPSQIRKIWSDQNRRNYGAGNNKRTSKNYSAIRRALWPTPHGEHSSNWEEFRKFRAAHWIEEFASCGWSVTSVSKGPFASGYGFGSRPLERLAETFGFSSEWIYVVRKSGHRSKFDATLPRDVLRSRPGQKECHTR